MSPLTVCSRVLGARTEHYSERESNVHITKPLPIKIHETQQFESTYYPGRVTKYVIVNMLIIY